MKCRSCKTTYDGRANRVCPKCGAPRPRVRPAFLKTSAILISTASAEGVYRSLEEVPAALRTKLIESTNGLNSATILIADRKGREEIARAVRRLPNGPAALAGKADMPSPRGRLRPSIRALRIAAAIVALVLVTLILWAVCARP
jgi:hypothetical protein